MTSRLRQIWRNLQRNAAVDDGSSSRSDDGLSSRSNYKGTWENLATGEKSAKMWVAGYTDEDELRRTGEHTFDVINERVGIHPSDLVLEIGCGVGRVGKFISPKCREWIGCDISSGMLRVALDRLKGLSNVRLVELKEVGLTPIADSSVDLVYCTVVFMHLFEWDRYRYFQEAYRVLEAGGRCFFDNVDITSSHGHKFFAEAASYPINERPAQIGMVSTGDELETYARWAGFKDIKIHRWDDAWVGVTGVK